VNDIILRDCGSVGWLGVVERRGKELYRTGKHHPFAVDALEAVQEWLSNLE
jgi:hypothetical protein